jgi:hypothetical protein
MPRKAYRAEPEVEKVGFLRAILVFDHCLPVGCRAAMRECERFTWLIRVEQMPLSSLTHDETPERISQQLAV